MAEFEKPRIDCVYESEDGRSAKFVVEPLEKGFGITLGTSLRRVMLSQLHGAAAASISIDGVTHEFSTIPGVKEDVTEIVLNLKSVNFKLHTDLAEVVIDCNKAGEITAGDINCSSDVEVLNPEQHIATLDDDAKLYIVIVVKSGKGWCVADKNKDGLPAGTIAIDSIFSPIEKVNVTVENTLVGNSTDYEKLIIDVVTNGAVTPMDAIKEAASILVKKLSLFTDGNDDTYEAVADTNVETINNEVYSTSVDDLDLNVRPVNCLKSAKIFTVGDIVATTPESIRKIPHLGDKSFNEIVEKLAALGIQYGNATDVNG